MEKNMNTVVEEEKKIDFKKVVIGGIVATVCFVAGRKYERLSLARGLGEICKIDPTLQEHMATAISDAMKAKMMGK